tara:strand:+ start:436 stop:1107 length:672 start_codon:yes stop_codon:yes gene_type:complete
MLRVILFSTLIVLASSIYELNPNATTTVIPIRVDKNLTIIDDFFLDIDAVLNVERNKLKKSTRNYYPGHRYELLKRPDNPYFEGKRCGFSEITTPPEELQNPQKIPHCDGQNWRALLVYLEDRPFDGTALYIHRESGQLACTKNKPILREELEYVLDTDGYMNGSNYRWEMIYKAKMIKNRAVIYDGDLYHSVDMEKWVPGRMTFGCFQPMPDPVHWTFDVVY